MKKNLLFLLYFVSPLLMAQKISPSSKLILPKGYEISEIQWQETILFQQTSLNSVSSGGLKFDRFEITETDKSGTYKHIESYPSIGSTGTNGTVTKYCYCDGAIVLVDRETFSQRNNGLVGGLMSSLDDGTETFTGFLYDTYTEEVKKRCYSMKVNDPSSEQKEKAEQLFIEAMKFSNNTSNDRIQKIQILDKAIEQNSNEGKYQYQKGLACYFEGVDIESVICFQNAILLDFQPDSSYYYKGRSLNFLGEYKQASVALDVATTLNPNFKSAWFYLGESHVKHGSFSDGLYALRKFLSLNPVVDEKINSAIKRYFYSIFTQKPFQTGN